MEIGSFDGARRARPVRARVRGDVALARDDDDDDVRHQKHSA